MMYKKLIGLLAAGAVIAPAIALAMRTGTPSPRLTPTVEGTSPFVEHPSAVTPDSRSQKLTVVSDSATRQKSPARAGKAVDVPYIPDFTDFNAMNASWSVYNNNNDGYSWELDERNAVLKCYAPNSGNSNDWAVTPGINLGKDDVYTLTFSIGSQASGKNNFKASSMEVKMGRTDMPSQMTENLWSDDNITYFWNGSMKTVSLTLPVNEDGVYYIGFHNLSPVGSYAIYLKDVKVEQNGSRTAPAAVGGLAVTAGDAGALEAVVSLSAPLTDADGGTLDALTEVRIFRDEEKTPAKVFESPAPGEALSFTDTGLTRGVHKYMAVALNDAGEGARCEASAYVGVDEPLPPANVHAACIGDDVVVTWEPSEGKNGGYTGGTAVSYTVVRYDGEDHTVASGITATKVTEKGLAAADEQSNISYSVVAATEAGVSEAAPGNSLFVGRAYSLPLKESFAYCGLRFKPWVMERINAGVFPTQWQLTAMGVTPACPPTDGDDGMLAFVTRLGDYNLFQGNVTRMAAPVVDLTTMDSPFVSFKLFHYDSTVISQEYNQETDEYETITYTFDDKIHLQISVDNAPYEDIPGTEILLNANNNGWTSYSFPLDGYRTAKRASVAIVGTADGGGNIFIDQFMIAGKVDNDIELVTLSGPESVAAGTKAGFVAEIMNNGTASTKNYTVDLFVDGKKVDSQTGQGAAIFANGGTKTVRLGYTPGHLDSGRTHEVKAVVNFAADQCKANDSSDAMKLEIPAVELPRVTDLNGNVSDGTVTIEWDEPVVSGFRPGVTDDMESYAPFVISNIGEYTLVDNDKSTTYGISNIQSYDNACAAMAWQVFHPAQAPIDIEDSFNRRWRAHSGNQYLISFAADQVSANDDWLISPELSGDAQTISFWIKSVTMAYTESFRVLYSTDTKSTSDFIKVAEAASYTPPSTWRRFSVKLPEGAKYFAIHCISKQAFGLMVDDVRFVPATSAVADLDFMGYDVYRDGTKVNDEPIGETSFTDNAPGRGTHTYTVCALFDKGVASPSEPFTADTTPSGIDAVDDSAAPAWICAGAGCIRVKGDVGTVSVYTADGRVAGTYFCTTELGIPALPGLYIVNSGAGTAKIVVK